MPAMTAISGRPNPNSPLQTILLRMDDERSERLL
jgi:hypothetical protein